MVNSKKITIQVGDVTLDTSNIPKQGIDLKRLSKEAQRILSCFDQNGDKKLSRAEINKAISVFAAQDKQYTEKKDETTLITHKKDKKLSSKELENVKLKTNEKFYSNSDKEYIELVRERVIKPTMKKAGKEDGKAIEKQYDKEVKEKFYRKHELTELGKQKAAELLNLQMIRNKAIESGKFKATKSDLWLQDQNGAYYKFDGKEFKKQDGVYSVTKDGGYKMKVKTNNPNVYAHKTVNNNDYITTMQLKSADGKKVYINKNYVAQKLGLDACGPNFPNTYKYTYEVDGEFFYRKGYYEWKDNKFIYVGKGNIDINVSVNMKDSPYYD